MTSPLRNSADIEPLLQSAGKSCRWWVNDCGGNWPILSNRLVCSLNIHLVEGEENVDFGDSQSVIVGCYVIIFGAGEGTSAAISTTH